MTGSLRGLEVSLSTRRRTCRAFSRLSVRVLAAPHGRAPAALPQPHSWGVIFLETFRICIYPVKNSAFKRKNRITTFEKGADQILPYPS